MGRGARGTQGPTGPRGVMGPVGPQGPAGAGSSNSWFNGVGAPGVGLGSDGDYYLNDSNGDVYQKVGGVWTLIANILGPTGPTGAATVWYNGSGAPGAGLGANGDYYLDTLWDNVYFKVAGAWTLIGNIKGSTGNTGPIGNSTPPGIDGKTGPMGFPGPQGKPGATWYTTDTGPDPVEGVEGDFHYEGDDNTIWHKEGGVWIVVGNIQGSQGDQGVIGLTGRVILVRDGRDGRDGLIPGATGQRGPIGLSGPPGLDGRKGDLGFPGPKGDTGASGSGSGGVDIKAVEIDFGNVPTAEKVFTVADAAVIAGQQISAWQTYDAAAGRTADENEFASMHIVAGQPNAGVGFSLFCRTISDFKELQGKFKINYLLG